jgi:hypothetical protein
MAPACRPPAFNLALAEVRVPAYHPYVEGRSRPAIFLSCGPQKLHAAVFNASRSLGLRGATFLFLNIADCKEIHAGYHFADTARLKYPIQCDILCDVT